MSYDGQRMKGIILKRAGRKETFETFVVGILMREHG